MSKRYRERPITDEDIKRRLMRYGWSRDVKVFKDPNDLEWPPAEFNWPEALHKAWNYDPTTLCRYLTWVAQGKLNPLDREQLDQLAALAYHRIHKGHRKKKGPIPPRDPDAITAHYVAALARTEVERMKRANGGNTPHGAVPKAINTIAQLLGDDGYSFNHIDIGEVWAIMRKRGKPPRQA